MLESLSTYKSNVQQNSDIENLTDIGKRMDLASSTTNLRIANLASHLDTKSKMGGGQPERILCIVPGDEPKEILEGLRSRHPGVEITYVQRQWGVRALPQNLAASKTHSSKPTTCTDCG
jgi:hypothetical protein